jgi:type VI secretion system VasD/TssJ family lipoprotein
MFNGINIILVLTSLMILNGCGGVKTLSLEVVSDDDANNGNAVVLTIYQLLNADKFRYASFESLMKKPEETLSSDIIPNSKYERTMIPGEKFKLDQFEIKQEAMFLGVVADFHSPTKDGWQQLVEVNSDIDEMLIIIHENSISLEKK